MSKQLRDAINRDWQESPYYDTAETPIALDIFWNQNSPFYRLFCALNLDHIVDLACGRGRHAEQIISRRKPARITLVDVNSTNIDACKARFKDDKRFRFIVNTGSDLADIDANDVSSVLSYDAMVHFEYDDALAYLKEIYRVLRPTGRALLHHSNNDREPGKLYHQCVHWRNFMSAPLLKHVAIRTGFDVEAQELINWNGDENGALDAVTLLRKPF